MKKSALALAAVLVLALTVFVSAGSAADVYSHSPKVDVYGHTVNVHPDAFRSTGFSSGPGQDVRSTAPKQDVRSTAPKQDVRSTAPDQDVRGHAAPKAAKAWAVKAWASKGW